MTCIHQKPSSSLIRPSYPHPISHPPAKLPHFHPPNQGHFPLTPVELYQKAQIAGFRLRTAPTPPSTTIFLIQPTQKASELRRDRRA